MADSFSKEQIEEWREDIEGFGKEPRTDFSKMQAIAALMDTIETALENRSYKEVADRLTKRGLAISEGSLKKYVSRYRNEHKTKPTSVTKKRTGKSKKKSHQENLTPQDSSVTEEAIHPLSNSDVETPETSSAKEVVNSVVKEAVSPSSKRTSKRLGRSRLSSDDSATRYPPGKGEPIQISSDL